MQGLQGIHAARHGGGPRRRLRLRGQEGVVRESTTAVLKGLAATTKPTLRAAATFDCPAPPPGRGPRRRGRRDRQLIAHGPGGLRPTPLKSTGAQP